MVSCSRSARRTPPIVLRQGHLGGEEGEVASHSVCSGDPDGGHAVQGSVVYLPCPNGVTAIKVSPKAPHLKQLWTDNDGAAGAPIIAGWTGLDDRTRQRGARPQPGQRRGGRLDPLRRVCEPLPDAVGRRWPAARFRAPTRSSPSWVRPAGRHPPRLPRGETRQQHHLRDEPDPDELGRVIIVVLSHRG